MAESKKQNSNLLKRSEDLFEIGKLYAEKCELLIAIVKIEEAADGFYELRDFSKYIDCQHVLLRLYAETKKFEQIRQTKERLQDLVIKEGLELNARTYYTLGICASHKQQYDVALEYFQKSLALALAVDEKKDICYAINGLAITYYNLKQYQEALKEIYNLKIFFQVMPLEEVEVTSRILNANILRMTKRYEEAIEILWTCYDSLKKSKNLYLYQFLLYIMGVTYKDSGQNEMAKMYLELAIKTIDPENLKWLSDQVLKAYTELTGEKGSEFDLVFDAKTNSVIERKKGKVDFKNQFILLDMLRMFMSHPGQVYSKETLVEQVWKQDYDPSVHDNKIYVTIKRLRRLIEPDYDKPKYIFRAKNGYYLNKNTSTLLDEVDLHKGKH